MTYEEVRDASLLTGGKARRPARGSEYVQFEDATKPSHARLLRGSSPETLVPFALQSDDALAEDWEIVP
jgi:hypothetical protein